MIELIINVSAEISSKQIWAVAVVEKLAIAQQVLPVEKSFMPASCVCQSQAAVRSLLMNRTHVP